MVEPNNNTVRTNIMLKTLEMEINSKGTQSYRETLQNYYCLHPIPYDLLRHILEASECSQSNKPLPKDNCLIKTYAWDEGNFDTTSNSVRDGKIKSDSFPGTRRSSEETSLTFQCFKRKERFNFSIENILQKCQPTSETSARSRRQRTVFSDLQLATLEHAFLATHYPDASAKTHFAIITGLTEERIEVWFKNRRAKWRRQRKNGASN